MKPTAANGHIWFIGAGGARAVYLDVDDKVDVSGRPATTYTLKALYRNGTVGILESFGTRSPERLVLSPDGNEWLWTELTTAAVSVLHLTASSGVDRIVASLQSDKEEIAAYRWDQGGAIVHHVPFGGGGIFPLGWGANGDVFLLNPQSGVMSPLWQGSASQCNFHARAADGTIACLVGASGGPYTLKIGKPPNVSISVPLSRARYGAAGSISFMPGVHASLLAIGGCSSWALEIQCATDLVDARTGDIWRSGPDGLNPPDGSWGWLDDGSLVEMGRRTSLSSGVTSYVVSSMGTARQLAVGTPEGVLRG